MSLHTPQAASLGDIEGRGYAFVRRTFRGQEVQGVFFGEEEDLSDLEALLTQEEVRFEGVVYNRLRSGKIRKKMKAFLVDVKNLLRVRAGERVDFKVLEEV